MLHAGSSGMLYAFVVYLLSIVPLQISVSDPLDSWQEVHIQGPIPLLLLTDPTDKTWS